MNLYRALTERVSAYLGREISLLDLREWVERHDPEVAESDDEALRSLDGDVWELLSEMDLGLRREDGVWAKLAQLHPQLMPASVQMSAAMTYGQVATSQRRLGILDLSSVGTPLELWWSVQGTRAKIGYHSLAGSFAG